MSLTFPQKSGPSSGHGPLGALQASRLSTDSRRASAALPGANGAYSDGVWQPPGKEFGWIS